MKDYDWRNPDAMSVDKFGLNIVQQDGIRGFPSGSQMAGWLAVKPAGMFDGEADYN